MGETGFTLRSSAFAASLLAAAVLTGPAAAPAGAAPLTAPTPPFVVTPEPASGLPSSYFALRARPGATTRAGKLLFTNRTGARLRLTIDPVDAVTATTLGSAYAERGSPTHGPTLWTRLSGRQIVITPHGSGILTVTVKVPGGTPGGDYLSGVAIQSTGSGHTQRLRSNVSVSSVARYVIGVELALPGPRHPRLQFTGASLERRPAGLTFLLDARNRGNVILQNVRGSVLITQGSRRVAAIAILPGTFVTATAIAYPVTAPREEPSPGTVYRVRAVLRYRGGVARLDRLLEFGVKQATVQQQFGGPKVASPGATPWAAIVIGALLAAVALATLAVVGARSRRRRRDVVAGALPVLGRALGRAGTAAPVSVIVIGGDPIEGDVRRRLEQLIRRRLRPADTLAVAPGGELAIVAPDTGAQSAAGFAHDLRVMLDRELGGTAGTLRIGTATSEGHEAAEALLEDAAADTRRPAGV